MITIKNQLYALDTPRVMAIVNVTPDSFAFACRDMTEDQVLVAASKALSEGADILDIGGCSTRPNATPVKEEEEWLRVSLALEVIRKTYPEAVLSVDTFRPSVAQRAIEQYGVNMVNDVSGGSEAMYEVVLAHRVPYILTHAQPLQGELVICEVLDYMVRQLDWLHRMGIRDVMIDPGFGFGKTLSQNYQLLAEMEQLQHAQAPIVVGLSRKSMIYETLHTEPQSNDALLGTAALHIAALERGASILRVHDVRAAKEVIALYERVASAPSYSQKMERFIHS